MVKPLRRPGHSELTNVRSPLSGDAEPHPKYDWFTHFGNQANTNRSQQDVRTTVSDALDSALRRNDQTLVDVRREVACTRTRRKARCSPWNRRPVGSCGVRFIPECTYLSLLRRITRRSYCCRKPACKSSRLRCLDAATGQLLWETPFTGSPSWNRQIPPTRLIRAW